MTISKENWGKTKDGTPVLLYTLSNRNMKAKISSFGAILVSLETADKDGNINDVVLGYDTLEEYVQDESWFGACIGRVANRIANGQFELNGKKYSLESNHRNHHLHGGSNGFGKCVFDTEEFENSDGPGLKFKYHSPDGESGYPGTMDVEFIYTLTHDNILRLEFNASTDQETPINLTHHSYFNLKGDGNGDILNHELELYADKYTATDDELIPTGEISLVQGTHLDFTSSRMVGANQKEHPELCDDNFIINGPYKTFNKAARLYEPESGRVMELYTTQPGLQIYTANHLDNTKGKQGRIYPEYGGLAMEPQHFPDSVHHPEFPSTILKPGEKFYQKSEFRFSIKN